MRAPVVAVDDVDIRFAAGVERTTNRAGVDERLPHRQLVVVSDVEERHIAGARH